ncbi:MBL fold metallo-hydrolase [bacterium]|nr:MBL fold metallo-hydrolase [bacterium]
MSLVDGGSCRALRGLLQPGQPFTPWRVPARAFLLEHPTRGRLLFDTGYAPRIYQVARLYRWLLDVRPAPTPLLDIDTVILSHFHPDHIAGCRDYPQARFLYSQQAWDSARQRGWRSGYLPTLLPDDFAQRAQAIENTPLATLPGWLAPFSWGRDVLGDGSLWSVDLPGHAVGQFGLAGEGQTGRFFLIADACFTSWEIDHRRTPNRLLLWAAGADRGAYLATLEKLSQLRQRQPELTMVPCHCPAAHLPNRS